MRKIDLTKAKVIVATHPSYAIDARMLAELNRYGLPVHNLNAALPVGNVIIRRNKIIQRLVLPVLGRFDWFIFIDHDHYPVKDQLDAWFDDVPEDAIGCEYDTGSDKSWLRPDTFHMGMVRVRSEVFRKVKPPWFRFTYNEEHTELTDCECNFFRNKLLAAGCSITCRGRIGHDSTRSWHLS